MRSAQTILAFQICHSIDNDERFDWDNSHFVQYLHNAIEGFINEYKDERFTNEITRANCIHSETYEVPNDIRRRRGLVSVFIRSQSGMAFDWNNNIRSRDLGRWSTPDDANFYKKWRYLIQETRRTGVGSTISFPKLENTAQQAAAWQRVCEAFNDAMYRKYDELVREEILKEFDSMYEDGLIERARENKVEEDFQFALSQMEVNQQREPF